MKKPDALPARPVFSFRAIYLLYPLEICVMLTTGKNHLSALPVTVDG
jgi:hypothetical protein